MISDFSISGVGTFRSVKNDKALNDCVLIFGENGSGKSTIAAALRSLQTAEGKVITDRKSVGAQDEPRVSVTANDNAYAFAKGKWSDACADIRVFDQEYVNRNVHSGNQMNNDHGKNLYSVILGESSGELVQNAAALEDKVDDQNRVVRNLAKQIESSIPRGMSLDEFVALPQNSNAADEISRLEEKISTHQKRRKLDRAQTFQKIELPELSDSFTKVLKKSIGNFLDNAEQRIHDHLGTKTSGASISWIEDGTTASNGKDCPFCGTTIADNELVAAYKGFFSRDYNTLKAEIKSLNGLIDAAYGERIIVQQQKTLSENAASKQFWEDYVEVPPLDETIFEEIDDEIGRTREKLQELAASKQQNPLDEIAVDFDVTLRKSLAEKIADYNMLVGVANERIEELRASQADGSVEQDIAQLDTLKAIGARYQPDVVELISNWQDASAKKEKLAKERKDVQKQIRKETKEVFESRGESINKVLDSFSAGFRLGAFDTNNRTKPPSVQIRVCFDGADSVRLDDKATDSERPFDAALSSGERNMLALALFVTDLAEDETPGDRIIVVDDPISNLDERRLSQTAKIVADIKKTAKQLLVLSHNNSFLDTVEETTGKGTQRLALVKSDSNHTLK